ncbi:MAG TPA: type I restriction enzyme endonuclease domain-containing protein [Anaerolineales bacterium]|nr:type I restriction enzyme endonuclease domain-containing protein [Anaerolineales bacterium]
MQAGLPKPDISILDEKFLEEFTWERGENLRIRLLNKLLQDEIQLRQRKNLIKYQSFKNKLDKALERYHQNALTAAEIVQIMVDIRR